MTDKKEFKILPITKRTHHRHHDFQPIDEVRITTVPRYKTSDLSGDEWRISAKIEYLKNGEVVRTRNTGNVESAMQHLYHHAVVFDPESWNRPKDVYCDQEGCKELATVYYALKKTFCQQCSSHDDDVQEYAQFCEAHSTRGDCGRVDADNNYIPINTDGTLCEHTATPPDPNVRSPSQFGGYVVIG